MIYKYILLSISLLFIFVNNSFSMASMPDSKCDEYGNPWFANGYFIYETYDVNKNEFNVLTIKEYKEFILKRIKEIQNSDRNSNIVLTDDAISYAIDVYARIRHLPDDSLALNIYYDRGSVEWMPNFYKKCIDFIDF